MQRNGTLEERERECVHQKELRGNGGETLPDWFLSEFSCHRYSLTECYGFKSVTQDYEK